MNTRNTQNGPYENAGIGPWWQYGKITPLKAPARRLELRKQIKRVVVALVIFAGVLWLRFGR